MAREATLQIEVVYALAEEQLTVQLDVPRGATVAQALALARAKRGEVQIDFEGRPVGIYGRLVAPGTVLREGDRIEIYRRLIADPKQARRRRAARKS